MDPEALEARLDAGPNPLRSPAPDLPRRVVRLGRGGQHFAGDISGEILDVVAVIAVLRDFGSRPNCKHRRPKIPNLAIEVVEVVLAGDVMPGRAQDSREQVADERSARIPDMQRSGRVRRDEL